MRPKRLGPARASAKKSGDKRLSLTNGGYLFGVSLGKDSRSMISSLTLLPFPDHTQSSPGSSLWMPSFPPSLSTDSPLQPMLLQSRPKSSYHSLTYSHPLRRYGQVILTMRSLGAPSKVKVSSAWP